MMIGIDLGTTNSLVCVYRNNKAELIPNALGEYMTKSAVSVLEDGTILTGAAAKERQIPHPEQTAVSFKRYMGTDRLFHLGSRSFLPQELSALVLKQLHEDARRYLGEEIEEAVISVPAYFDDNQRNATKLAAQLAGLKVRRLINEPSAAALYHNLHAPLQDCRLMVIDFGGGTLDVSIMECFENIMEIIAVAGDNRLGGDDVDMAIAEYFCRSNSLSFDALSAFERASLLRQSEGAKRALSEAAAPVWICLTGKKEYRMELDKGLLRRLCQPLFERMKKVIIRAVNDSHLSPGELDDIVLVGGSARLAVLGDFLEELMGKRPAAAADPDYMVAKGSGICAGIKSRLEGLRDIVMTDVCPFSLGIATYNDARDRNPHMATLIPRSSMLPASRSDTFYTLHDHQTHIRLEIYQGEGYYASDNRKLGELTVRVPSGLAGKHFVKVNFAYDIDGILHVDAKSSGGDECSRVIVNPRVQLSEEELLQKTQELKRLSFAAEGSEEDHLLMAKAERLFAELTGYGREQAALLLQSYRHVLQYGDRIALMKMRRDARVRVKALEAQLYADPWEAADRSIDSNRTDNNKEE